MADLVNCSVVKWLWRGMKVLVNLWHRLARVVWLLWRGLGGVWCWYYPNVFVVTAQYFLLHLRKVRQYIQYCPVWVRFAHLNEQKTHESLSSKTLSLVLTLTGAPNKGCCCEPYSRSLLSCDLAALSLSRNSFLSCSSCLLTGKPFQSKYVRKNQKNLRKIPWLFRRRTSCWWWKHILTIFHFTLDFIRFRSILIVVVWNKHSSISCHF